jgi:thiosulfate/3-mercaptopyruvate sulfurtransferase
MNVMSPLIAAEDIREVINTPGVIIIDARGGADAAVRYRNAHVASAVFLDLETDLSQKGPDAAVGGRHPLPDIHRFARLLGDLGVGPATHVIVYDDKAGANAAARFWWMMKALGHEKVQVVNGGLAALDKAGVPMSTEILPRRPSGQPYPVTSWLLPVAAYH